VEWACLAVPLHCSSVAPDLWLELIWHVTLDPFEHFIQPFFGRKLEHLFLRMSFVDFLWGLYT